MAWQLTFHFEDYPHVPLLAYVSADNETEATTKFKTDYPNLADCVITEIINISI